MKKYIGTKVINALPMNRQEYNDFRGCQLPADEDGTDEGYLVEYVDGGKANTPQYAGYVSWLPKAVFEKAYKIADTFKDRLVIEKDELVNRHCKLGDFISSENFEKVVPDGEQRSLLCLQYKAMGEYLMILKKRIETITD